MGDVRDGDQNHGQNHGQNHDGTQDEKKRKGNEELMKKLLDPSTGFPERPPSVRQLIEDLSAVLGGGSNEVPEGYRAECGGKLLLKEGEEGWFEPIKRQMVTYWESRGKLEEIRYDVPKHVPGDQYKVWANWREKQFPRPTWDEMNYEKWIEATVSPGFMVFMSPMGRTFCVSLLPDEEAVRMQREQGEISDRFRDQSMIDMLFGDEDERALHPVYRRRRKPEDRFR